jgi:hypothetical protein
VRLQEEAGERRATSRRSSSSASAAASAASAAAAAASFEREWFGTAAAARRRGASVAASAADLPPALEALVVTARGRAGRGGTLHHVILQSKHQLMTAGMIHVPSKVTNLTPGSECNSTSRGRSAAAGHARAVLARAVPRGGAVHTSNSVDTT